MRPIDADALNIRRYCRWFDDPNDIRAVERMIREAPTIAPPPNTPLTLDELRKMDGEIVFCIPPNEWAKPTEFGLQFFGQSITLKWHEILHKYGKTWTAYRRKPEEEQ